MVGGNGSPENNVGNSKGKPSFPFLFMCSDDENRN